MDVGCLYIQATNLFFNLIDASNYIMLHARDMVWTCSENALYVRQPWELGSGVTRTTGAFGNNTLQDYMGQESGLEEARPFDRACDQQVQELRDRQGAFGKNTLQYITRTTWAKSQGLRKLGHSTGLVSVHNNAKDDEYNPET